MEELLLHQLLDRAFDLFNAVGVRVLHTEHLAVALDLSPAAFRELFGSKAGLLTAVLERNMQRQQREQAQLLSNLATPVEGLVALLRHGLHELRRSPHFDYDVVQAAYPTAWAVVQAHLHEYAGPLLKQLLREGIREGQFRADLDPELVSCTLLAQLDMLLNGAVFPPEQFNLADVYRTLFGSFIRGLCTPAGFRLVASHFDKL